MIKTKKIYTLTFLCVKLLCQCVQMSVLAEERIVLAMLPHETRLNFLLLSATRNSSKFICCCEETRFVVVTLYVIVND